MIYHVYLVYQFPKPNDFRLVTYVLWRCHHSFRLVSYPAHSKCNWRVGGVRVSWELSKELSKALDDMETTFSISDSFLWNWSPHKLVLREHKGNPRNSAADDFHNSIISSSSLCDFLCVFCCCLLLLLAPLF